MTRFWLFFLLLVTMPLTLNAAGVPTPVNPHEKIKSLQGDVETKQKQQKETEAKARKAEKELKQTKQELVKTGNSVQKSEKTLNLLELQISSLEEEKAALEDKLRKNRHSIGAMVLGLERIRRIPPEALIARPGAPFKTAQSAMLMGDIVPVLDRQADEVKSSLERLEEITRKLENQKKQVADVVADMTAEQKNLKALAEKREKLFASTHEDLESQKENIKRYAAQAQTLQDLMTKIEEQGKQETLKAKPASFAKRKTLLPQTGSMRLPVSGAVLTNYNEPDDFGAPSKGLTIESRPGALVVAPMGGVVRFAGRFRNYGNMLIVEHKKGFHSLIAGLEKIDTVVGQSVSAGEPLGFAHKSVANGVPSVYYELRQNGNPVNPARVFAGLG